MELSESGGLDVAAAGARLATLLPGLLCAISPSAHAGGPTVTSAAAHEMIELQTGAVTPVLSRALRAMFVASPGYRLIGADFSNIEGRINAWMADEHWKLDAFRAYDAGTGPDLYKLTYAKTFGVAVEDVTAFQRQSVGKVMELALGYQGSVGAWLRFNPDPTAVAAITKAVYFGSDQWRKAAEQYDRTPFHNGLSADQWIAIKIIVNLWREAHPNIVDSWWARQDAAIEAVDNPGVVVTHVRSDRPSDGFGQIPLCGGRIRYLVSEGFLWCRLPSGKLLAYCRPRLVDKQDDWLIDDEGNAYPANEFTADEIALRLAAGQTLQEGRRKLQVAYDGANQKTKAWGTQYMYGGSQTNNDVQGTARELLRFAMMNVEAANYPIVLHVHDELVSEVQQQFGSVDEYQSIMSILPPWLAGLPLAAKAWTDHRYVK